MDMDSGTVLEFVSRPENSNMIYSFFLILVYHCRKTINTMSL